MLMAGVAPTGGTIPMEIVAPMVALITGQGVFILNKPARVGILTNQMDIIRNQPVARMVFVARMARTLVPTALLVAQLALMKATAVVAHRTPTMTTVGVAPTGGTIPVEESVAPQNYHHSNGKCCQDANPTQCPITSYR